MSYMKKSAEELIAMAGTLSLAISKSCADIEDLTAFIEFFGLMRHNLELIRNRRIHEQKHSPQNPPNKN